MENELKIIAISKGWNFNLYWYNHDIDAENIYSLD